MNDPLQYILINTDRCGIKPLSLEQIAVVVFNCEDVGCVRISIEACVPGLERHQLVEDWLLGWNGHYLGHVQVVVVGWLGLVENLLFVHQYLVWCVELHLQVALLTGQVVVSVVAGVHVRIEGVIETFRARH